MAGKSFVEHVAPIYAVGVTVNGAPVITGREVTTVCQSLGNKEYCNETCEFARINKCDGGIVHVRHEEV